MNTQLEKQRGFTLIEILLYTALLGTVLAASIFLTRAAIDAYAKTRTALLLEQNIRFAFTRIIDRVHEANDIAVPASGTGAELTLSMDDAALDPTTITVSDGVVTITEGTGQATALTSSEIDVTTLLFTRLGTTPASVRVHIEGTLRNATAQFQSQFSLTGTAVVRR